VVSLGSAHGAGITDMGHLMTWGSNAQGQCGVDPKQPLEEMNTSGGGGTGNAASHVVQRPVRVRGVGMGRAL
jgi:alpha-tubulin suppressor-like RCC1 family protein